MSTFLAPQQFISLCLKWLTHFSYSISLFSKTMNKHLIYIYIYIYILSSTNRVFRCIPTLQCG